MSLVATIALQIPATPSVVEWLDQTADYVSIQAIIKLPSIARRDRALLRMATGTLGQDTSTYSRNQIQDIVGRTGSRVRAVVSEDHVRVSIEVVPADLATGVSMMHSLLRESSFLPESLSAVADDLTFRRFSDWRQALEPVSFTQPRYQPADLKDLLAMVFRPENIYLSVGGKLQPGLATQKWSDLTASWKMARSRPGDGDNPSPEPVYDGSLSFIEFEAPSFPARDAAFSSKLLALTALGTGKSALLWRVARTDLAMSYRQEAVLSPVVEGFQPRLIIAHSSPENLEQKAEKVKGGLIAGIEAWTQADLKRALGMADSYLVRGGDLSPLYFSGGNPVSRSVADQTFIRGYWLMKTGTQWNPHNLVGRMGFVELEDLKQTALAMVRDAKIRLLKGK